MQVRFPIGLTITPVFGKFFIEAERQKEKNTKKTKVANKKRTGNVADKEVKK